MEVRQPDEEDEDEGTDGKASGKMAAMHVDMKAEEKPDVRERGGAIAGGPAWLPYVNSPIRLGHLATTCDDLISFEGILNSVFVYHQGTVVRRARLLCSTWRFQ